MLNLTCLHACDVQHRVLAHSPWCFRLQYGDKCVHGRVVNGMCEEGVLNGDDGETMAAQ